MKKSRIAIICLFIIIISISFFVSFSNDKKLNEKRRKVEKIVLDYLKDKYNEEFKIVDYSFEKNSYNVDDGDEYTNKKIESSNIYNLTVLSTRLIEFNCLYVEYEDDYDYQNNIKYNIIEPGVYENYIYEYKIRDIKNDLRESVLDIVSDSLKVDISISDIFNGVEEMLIIHSLDEEDDKKLYEEYMTLNKNISNLDYFNLCRDIDNNSSLILNIEVNNYVFNENISNFKEEVIKLVNYLYISGYQEYEINFQFNKYQSARVTKYFESNEEKIYLIFDYQGYSNIDNEDRLGIYILDK